MIDYGHSSISKCYNDKSVGRGRQLWIFLGGVPWMIIIWFKILYNKLFIQIIWFLNCYIHISETMRQDNRICKYTYAIFDYFLSMRSVHTMLLGQFLIPHSPEHEFTWYWVCTRLFFGAKFQILGKVWFEGTSQDDLPWASCYKI